MRIKVRYGFINTTKNLRKTQRYQPYLDLRKAFVF